MTQPDEDTQEEEAKPKPSASEGSDGVGVTVPEEFQKAVHGVMKQATTKQHLNHISDRVGEAHDEMRKKEMKTKPKVMTMEDGPSLD